MVTNNLMVSFCSLLFTHTVQYASVKHGEEDYLSYNDFVSSFLQLTGETTPPDTVQQLAAVADTSRSG